MKSRILLAGFGHFGKLEINPSESLVRQLAQVCDLPFVIMPTSYTLAWPTLKIAVERFAPDFVVSFGVGRTTAALRLETTARNVYTASQADVDGDIRTGKIHEVGDAELSTRISIRDLAEELVKHGHDVIISGNAGGYVCNQLYYLGLSSLGDSNGVPAMLFAHISGPELDPRSLAAAMHVIHYIGVAAE